MVVLFEDCCKKVELHLRYIKLQRILMEKIFELRSLEYQEKRVMKGEYKMEVKCVQNHFRSCVETASVNKTVAIFSAYLVNNI